MSSLCDEFFVEPLESFSSPTESLLESTCAAIEAAKSAWSGGHGNQLHDAVALMAYVLQKARDDKEDRGTQLNVKHISISEFDKTKNEKSEILCAVVQSVLERMIDRGGSPGGFKACGFYTLPSFESFKDHADQAPGAPGAFGVSGQPICLNGSMRDVLNGFRWRDADDRGNFFAKVRASIDRLHKSFPLSQFVFRGTGDKVSAQTALDTLIGVVGGAIPDKETLAPGHTEAVLPPAVASSLTRRESTLNSEPLGLQARMTRVSKQLKELYDFDDVLKHLDLINNKLGDKSIPPTQLGKLKRAIQDGEYYDFFKNYDDVMPVAAAVVAIEFACKNLRDIDSKLDCTNFTNSSFKKARQACRDAINPPLSKKNPSLSLYASSSSPSSSSPKRDRMAAELEKEAAAVASKTEKRDGKKKVRAGAGA